MKPRGAVLGASRGAKAILEAKSWFVGPPVGSQNVPISSLGLSWAPLLQLKGSILGGPRLHFEAVGSLGATWRRLGLQKGRKGDSGSKKLVRWTPRRLPKCAQILSKTIAKPYQKSNVFLNAFLFEWC